MLFSVVVPDEAHVEGFGGEHGEDDHGGEGEDAGRGVDLRQPSVDERAEQGDDEDVYHRPAANEVDEFVEAGLQARRAARVFVGEEIQQYRDFEKRGEDAGKEDDERDAVGAVVPE